MIHRCAEHGRPGPADTHRWVCPCGRIYLSRDGEWIGAGIAYRDQPTIRPWRGAVMVVLMLAVVLAVCVVLEPLIGGLHWLLSGTIAGVIGYCVYAILIHFLRPWYRPIPKAAQWTEDRL